MDATLKFKRQVRDYYNKNVNTEETIQKVADAMGYERKEVQKVGSIRLNLEMGPSSGHWGRG